MKTKAKLLAAGVVAVGLWTYSGFMNPDTMLHGITAGSECVDFAKKRDVFSSTDEIATSGLRVRHGKFVVDLNATAPGKDEMKSRTCVIGDGYIQIVSMLEAGFWL